MKGKGEMTTYFLIAKKPGTAALGIISPSGSGNTGQQQQQQSQTNQQRNINGNGLLQPNPNLSHSQGSFSGSASSSSSLFNAVNNDNLNHHHHQMQLQQQHFQLHPIGGEYSNVQSIKTFQNIESQPQQKLQQQQQQRLSNCWSANASPRLPMISEDQSIHEELSSLTESIPSQRLPSYNEPKPIFVNQEQPKGPQMIQKLQKIFPQSRHTVAPSSKNNIDPKRILLETSLDTMPNQSKKISKNSFVFDKNSSIDIKSQVFESNLIAKLHLSPTVSHRTRLSSIADTTKATIQSQESLDKLLDSVYSKPYELSSDGEETRDDNDYGKIIKQNYTKSYLLNDYDVEIEPRNSSRQRHPSNVAQVGTPSDDDYEIEPMNNDDEYCVFVPRNEVQAPKLLPKIVPKPKHRHLLDHQRKTYQAHNSPMIVHKFYHIDDMKRKQKQPKNRFHFPSDSYDSTSDDNDLDEQNKIIKNANKLAMKFLQKNFSPKSSLPDYYRRKPERQQEQKNLFPTNLDPKHEARTEFLGNDLDSGTGNVSITLVAEDGSESLDVTNLTTNSLYDSDSQAQFDSIPYEYSDGNGEQFILYQNGQIYDSNMNPPEGFGDNDNLCQKV